MAKINNPQNQYGEDLATDKRINELIENRLVPVEDDIEEIKSKIIPESKIDISNLDDSDLSVIETFTNLNSIQFAGKYVNVIGDEDGIITVYINEDNSLPTWDGGNVNLSPSSATRYIYGVPAGLDLEGNKQYNYVAATSGVQNIKLIYSGDPFTLFKPDYTLKVDYKVNGISKTKSIFLGNYISSKTPNETTEILTFNNEGLSFSYIQLGYDKAPYGKTPGNLEVQSFEINIPLDEIGTSDCLVSGITLSFMHDKATDFTLSSSKEIYFWTTPANNIPSGTITFTEALTDIITISGLKYYKGGSTNNTITATIALSNLANGSLNSNTITMNTSGLAVSTLSDNSDIILDSADKGHTLSATRKYKFNNSFNNKILTVTANVPTPLDSTISIKGTTARKYNVYGVSDSTDLKESFKNENKRTKSDFTTKWAESTIPTETDAIVQNGKLYHIGGDYSDGGVISGDKANYKNLASSSPCSFYRVFKPANSTGTTNTFYIEGVNNLLNNTTDVELIVYPHDGSDWETTGYIANKVATSSNGGIAESALVNEKIKCNFPQGHGTEKTYGIRMEIKIKNSKATVSPITISF